MSAVTVNNSGANDVSLNNGANALTVAGTVGRDLTTSAGATAFNATSVGRNLGVTASGAVSQSGALTVSGTANVSAGANGIALNNAANDFVGAVTVNNSGANDVSLNNGANALTVAGTVGRDLTTSAGATAFNATSVGRNLAVTASGAVSQGGALTVSGTANVSAGANGITLNNGGNDFVGAVTVNNSGANDVNLNNGANALTVAGTVGRDLTTSAGATAFNATSVGRNLAVTASGAVSQGGALTVSGTANVSAGANGIALNNGGNDFVGAVTVNNSGANDVNLNNGANALTVAGTVGRDLTTSAGATAFNATTVGGNLAATASGAITESGALTVNGAGKTASFAAGAGNDITLDTQNNDFTSVSIVSGKDVKIKDVNGIGLGASTVSGNLTVTAPNGITLNGNISSGAGQTYNNAVTLGSTVTLVDSGSGTILFSSTVDATTDGGQGLTARTNGTTEFDAAVGGIHPLTSLDLKGYSSAGSGSTLLGAGSVTTKAGGQTYENPLTLSQNTTVSDTTSGNIGFNQTVDSEANKRWTLEADTLGTTTFGGAVGAALNGELGALTTDAAGNTVINADVTTTAGQTYNDPVTLGGAGTLRTLSGVNVDFAGTVTGSGKSLTVNDSGTTTFGGAVNGVNALITDAAGNTVINADITTTAGQTYNDLVTLAGGARTLTGVSVQFDSTVSGAADNSGLTVAGATLLNGASVNTGTGNQDYQGAVTLAGGAKTLTGGSVEFDSTVSGAADNSGLTVAGATVLNGASVNTGTGNQDYQGAMTLAGGAKTLTGGSVQFDNTVSGAADNSGLTVAGGTVLNGASVNTGAGNQDYQGAMTLAGGAKTLTGGSVQFDNTVSGAADNSGLTVAGATLLNGASVNTGTGNQDYQGAMRLAGGAKTLTGGSVEFDSTVSGAADNSGLTVAGATVLNGASVNTGTGNQDYQGAMTLAGGAKTLTGGSVQFDNTVSGAADNSGLTVAGGTVLNGASVNTGAGNQDYQGAMTLAGGAKTLTGGSVQFDNTVSGAADNSGLTVAGATLLNGASVNTGTGNQDYQGAMRLAGGAKTLTGGSVEFDSTVSGAADNSGLTVAGATVLNGASVNTGTGNQDYQGAMTLAGGAKTLTGGSVQFDNTVSGAADNSGLTVAGGTVLNGASVNTGTGNQDYQGAMTLAGGAKTLTGGSVQFANTVSGAADNSGLTVAGATLLNGASVNTGTGNQDYQGAVTLAGGAKTLTGGSVEFDNTVSGAANDSGLTVAGATVLNGASVNTGTGNQDYQGAVTLAGGAKTLTGGSVQFDSTVSGAADNSGLTVAGATLLNGASVNTGTGNQDYQGAVTLAGGTKTLTGGSVQFDSTVSGAADNSGLTVAGATLLNGASVNTGTGNQDYQGAATLAGGAKTLTGGSVQFDNSVSGAADNSGLTVNGNAVLNGGSVATGTGSQKL